MLWIVPVLMVCASAIPLPPPDKAGPPIIDVQVGGIEYNWVGVDGGLENHLPGQELRPQLRQIILWDHDGNVMLWQMIRVPVDRIKPEPDFRGGKWVMEMERNGKRYRIWANIFCRTWTIFDREIQERKFFHIRLRRKLP